MSQILCFIGGIVVGIIVGEAIMGLCAMSKEVDKEMDKVDKEIDRNAHI